MATASDEEILAYAGYPNMTLADVPALRAQWENACVFKAASAASDL